MLDSVKSETRQVWAQILFNNTYTGNQRTFEINDSESQSDATVVMSSSDVFLFET